MFFVKHDVQHFEDVRKELSSEPLRKFTFNEGSNSSQIRVLQSL
jgi:hypothetical protein